jgi:hypothetical protein
MQLEELRMNQKMGEDDPALVNDLETHRAQFEKKYEELAEELKAIGTSGTRPSTAITTKTGVGRWTAWSICSTAAATSGTWFGT